MLFGSQTHSPDRPFGLACLTGWKVDFDRKETSLKKKSTILCSDFEIFEFLEIIKISFKILKELVIDAMTNSLRILLVKEICPERERYYLWGALATRIFDKNYFGFFLVKSEDLIVPKMKRTRHYDQTPFAQTKKAFFFHWKCLFGNHLPGDVELDSRSLSW